MNNVVAYTSTLFTRRIKRYITPNYYSITGLGSRTIPEPLPRKLMNKGVIKLTRVKGYPQSVNTNRTHMNNAIKRINGTGSYNDIIDVCWNNHQNRYDSIALANKRTKLTRRKMNKILANTIGWQQILKPITIT